jgi:CHAT domain-containing protein
LEEKNNLTTLPGTKTEVENIGNLLAARGTHCFKPRVMHIATHGYFHRNTTGMQNPLLQSGLLLTGAAQTLEGNKDEMMEDGILTAYEAMNLNFG